MSSNNRGAPPDDFDFDDAAPVQRGSGPPPEDDIEDFPNPSRPRAASADGDDGDDFSDVDGDGGDGGGGEGADPADGGDVDPAPQGGSTLSKLIMPLGGAALLAVAGGGGYMMFGDMLFPADEAPPQSPIATAPTQPGPQPTGFGPAQPPIPGGPGPMAQSPSQFPPTGGPGGLNRPGLPAPGPMAQAPGQMPPPSGGPGQQGMQPFGTPGGMLSQSGAIPGGFPPGALPGLGQGPSPAAQPAPVQAAVSPQLESALSELVTSLRGMTTRFDQLSGNLTTTRNTIVARLDQTDERIAAVGTQVGGVEQRMGTIEQRVTALETARSAPPEPQRPAARTAARAERPAPAPAPRAERSQRREASAPTIAPRASAADSTRVISGFALRGVSRDAALVETPRGIQRFERGQSIPGGGVFREIRPDGDSWVLVTSSGVIRP